MRFIAAGAIVTVHSGFITADHGMGRLSIGVSFFFVLSGFVLTWSWRGVRASSFYRNRFARIYPVYVVAWVLGLWTEAHLRVHTSPLTLVTTLTLTQTWVNDSSTYFGANGAAWSLSCEAFFYAAFPALIHALSRATPAQRRTALLACVVFTVIMDVRYGSEDPSRFMYYLTFICPLGRVPEFIAGMIVALEVRDGFRCPPWIGLLALGALTAALLRVSPSSSDDALSIVPFLVFITSGVTADLRRSWNPLRTKVLVVLGSASYCLYLVHVPVYSVARIIHSGPWTTTSQVIGLTAIALCSLLLAEALHYFVERPFEARLRTPAVPSVTTARAMPRGRRLPADVPPPRGRCLSEVLCPLQVRRFARPQHA